MNEKMEILKMLEQGKITADEAGRLLEAIETETTEVVKIPDNYDNIKGKLLRVRIEADDDDDKVDVNINLPLVLLKYGIKMGGIKNVDLSEMDINSIFEAVARGEVGEIMTIDADKAKVRIYVD